MLCLVCTRPAGGRELCGTCLRGLEPCPARLLASGGVVWSGHRHEGPARTLIHRLKYQGLEAAARVLARGMSATIPGGATALIPVPRAVLRKWRHGTDPAIALALHLGRITGLPVVLALRAAPWWPTHAGRPAASRTSASLRQVASVPASSLLVDDVITSGSTLSAAQVALEAPMLGAVTATSAV